MASPWVSDQKMDLRRRGADSWRAALLTIFRLLLSLDEVSDGSLGTNNNISVHVLTTTTFGFINY